MVNKDEYKCEKWVHKKCNNAVDSLFKESKSSVFRGCTDHPASTPRTIVDIVSGVSLKLVDKFHFLDDMLSPDGDADAEYKRNGISIGYWHLCIPTRMFPFS